MAGVRSRSAASAVGPPVGGAVRPERRLTAASRRVSTSFLLPLFMLSLAIPLDFNAGPLRLSPYRAILILTLLPCIIAWLSGKSGRIRLADVLLLLSVLWASVALVVHHGVGPTWETSGILLIETFGAYLLARKLIRTPEDFRRMARVLFWMICVFLPFAAIEAVTGRALLLEVVGAARNMPELRLGLNRSQVVFQNSILYGVFAASAFGLVWYTLGTGASRAAGLLRIALVTAATFFSLTAGGLAVLNTQIGLSVWNYVTRSIPHRWLLFALLLVAAYVTVDLLSNRTPMRVFVSYLTFSPTTGYGRLLIWHFGSTEVMNNPLFGIGFGDWERPSWMGSSVDNFWLLVAMRYGLPAFVCLAGAFVLIVAALARAKLNDERIRACRAGLLVTLGGLAVGAATVHYWNEVYTWFLFLLGSGMWMLESSARSTREAGGTPPHSSEGGAKGAHAFQCQGRATEGSRK